MKGENIAQVYRCTQLLLLLFWYTHSKGEVLLRDDCTAPEMMKTVLVTEGHFTSLHCGNGIHNSVAVQCNHLSAKPQITGQEV